MPSLTDVSLCRSVYHVAGDVKLTRLKLCSAVVLESFKRLVFGFRIQSFARGVCVSEINWGDSFSLFYAPVLARVKNNDGRHVRSCPVSTLADNCNTRSSASMQYRYQAAFWAFQVFGFTLARYDA